MSFNVIVTIIMMITIVALIVTNASHPGIILAGVPLVAALVMGFSVAEIQTFVNAGVGMICSTLCLMIFAIMFFGILHEAGVFVWLVNKILGILKNSVLGVMLATCVITILTQLDGSGSTTALCTIPPLKPVYEKMHIRRQALLFLECLGSGTFICLPWAPAINEGSAYLGVQAYDVFQCIIPLAIFATILYFLLTIPLSIIEKRHGAGMTPEEYEELKKELKQPVELPYGKFPAVFGAILTLVIMILLLTGVLPSSVTFIMGYIVLMIVTFRKTKVMGEYIKKQAPMVLNLTMTMLGVSVLVGIINGTGAMAEFADVVAASSGSIARHLPFICAMFSLPLSFLTGNAKMSVVIPAVAAIAAPFGYAPEMVFGAILMCGAAGAGVNPFSGSSYLGLNLAGLEMSEHLKYSLIPLFLVGVADALFLGITGLLPF
jgi:citrate-Mg2+:H+ or citrate-Ca2+:H+ symporter, CitMHS family